MEAVRGLLTTFAAILGLICAMAAVAAHGGRWSPRLDVLTHFAPFWLCGGLLVAIYALTETDGVRRGLLFLALVGVAASGLLIAPEYIRPDPPKAAPGARGELKLIQFNVWGRNRDLAATIDWIVRQDPDVVVLEQSRAAWPLLAKATGYHVARGTDDLVILSKRAPVSSGVTLPPGGWAVPPLARATFEDAHGAFTVVGVHYIWPVFGGYQQAQGRATSMLLRQFPRERLILTGDFNSTPWSFSRRREDMLFGLQRRTRALFTWPAGRFSRSRVAAPFPLLPIDHVYAGGDWATVSVERGPRLGSDHYPVVVVLAPVTGASPSPPQATPGASRPAPAAVSPPPPGAPR